VKVLILGAGAVGGYIGAKLQTAGADVLFVVRGARLASLRDGELIIRSPLGDVARRVAAVEAPAAGTAPDVVVLACKAPALAGALDVVGPSIGPGTRVLPFLNGITHLGALGGRFPQAEVLGGIVHGAVALNEDGVIEHLTPFFSVIVGSPSTPADPVAADLVRLLEAAGVDARLSHDIRQDMWNKFVFLTTLAGITCLMRASIGTIVATDDGRDLIVRLLEECRSVAHAEGSQPDAAAMASYERSLTERGSTFTSSMLRDVLGGRPTEADHVLGDMLRRARRHGLETPMLATAHAHLQCLDVMRGVVSIGA
jgi:2-dehydropantoate 2-reductase